MKDKFLAAINAYNMFKPGDSVVAGVSGGADSMCLLSLLFSMRDELKIRLTAAHLNHGIRGEEALRDENFVREFCACNGIELVVRQTDIPLLAAQSGKSTELCAREERYAFFESLKSDKIATAHTGSDCVETLLMNLSRGSSLKGLTAIPPVRGNIVRPLIAFTRKETEKYCEDNNIFYVTDSTNLTEDYTRNKYRLSIISQLKQINSAFETNAMRCIALLRSDEDFISLAAGREFCNAYKPEDKSLDFKLIENRHKSIISRVIAEYIQRHSVSDFEMRHIELLYENIGNKFSLTLPYACVVNIDGGVMTLKDLLTEKNQDRGIKPVSFNKNEAFHYTDGEIQLECYVSDTLNKDSCSFAVDFFKIDDIIICRSRQPGDSLSLKERRCTKTLKKLYNELKIPVDKREKIPILADSSGIIAVAGLAADSGRLPDSSSTKYLIIKTECGKNE